MDISEMVLLKYDLGTSRLKKHCLDDREYAFILYPYTVTTWNNWKVLIFPWIQCCRILWPRRRVCCRVQCSDFGWRCHQRGDELDEEKVEKEKLTEWVATLDDENIEKENFDENINEGGTTNIVENINDWGTTYVVYVGIDWNTNVVDLG